MVYGYAGKILRLDMKNKTTSEQELMPEEAYKWVGGSSLGIKILTQEVPTEARWDDPINKVIISGGMLTGMPGVGSGVLGLVTKGALTNGVTQSQSNGYFSAFLKLCGYDAVIIEEQSEDWVYVYIDEYGIKFENADFLMGLDTTETQHALHKKYGTNRYTMSVYCIGPAGENLSKFAMFTGDYGHVAAHNGSGAVLGMKKLKAIAVRKGKKSWPIYDRKAFMAAGRKMNTSSCAGGAGKETAEFGTLVGVPGAPDGGVMPVMNGNTTVWPAAVEFDPHKIRHNLYDVKRTPCYGCNWTHCIDIKLYDERFKDKEAFEEPEAELGMLFSGNIGNEDIPYALWLSNLVDRVGLDGNEMGWMAAWVIDCFERGYFTPEMFDNEIDLHWGDCEGVEKLINIVANRKGKMGDILAEGIKSAAERLGSPAKDQAMYVEKGNIMRGHDHRTLVMSHEYLDVNTSSSGTVEVVGGFLNATEHGIAALTMPDRKDPFMLARHNAAIAGRRVMEDSAGCCRFFTEKLDHLREAMSMATGYDYTYEEFMKAGKRAMAMARIYNINSGITYRVEKPSKKYGSRQPDGPFAATTHLGAIIEEARSNFFEFMGYDRLTGIPTPERLEQLDIREYIPFALKAFAEEYGKEYVFEKYPEYCSAYSFGEENFEVNPARVKVADFISDVSEPFVNFFDRPKPETLEEIAN